jgi:D-alanine-D-alanine ligase
MKVGITFDLRSMYLKYGYSEEETAEFDDEQTIKAIEEHLNLMGFETERIGNANELMCALMAGKRWDLVFNICEGMYGEGREALVPALLDNYLIPYVFSGPVVLGFSLNKHLCKILVASSGVKVPDGILVNNVKELDDIDLKFPLFVKPVSEGTGKGISEKSLVNSIPELKESVSFLLKKFNQNVMVEEYLPGREFTVGVVGNAEAAEVIGVMEVVCNNSDFYGYETKENYKIRASYNKVNDIEYSKCSEIALKVWNVLGALDGGRIDLRIDKYGEINFMEINPLAGLNPFNSDLPILAAMHEIDYSKLLNKIINASLQRHGMLNKNTVIE